jgi:hypothetical protein
VKHESGQASASTAVSAFATQRVPTIQSYSERQEMVHDFSVAGKKNIFKVFVNTLALTLAFFSLLSFCFQEGISCPDFHPFSLIPLILCVCPRENALSSR